MSLRVRLAVWYGSLTTVIVALVCAYSYAVHARTHYDELDRVLHGVSDQVRAELNASPARRHEIVATPRPLGSGIRLFDREGRLIDQSPTAGITDAIDPRPLLARPNARAFSALASLAPALHAPGEATGRFGLVTDDVGRRVRVYAQPVDGGAEILIATLALAPIDASVRTFAYLMWVMALAGGMVAFGVGWLVARRALRPISVMTETAASIAESREFSRRVADGSARDELGRLAYTFNAMLASLQEAYESQVRFVSAASHELRAPLTIMQANLDLLRSAPMGESERRAAIGEASSEAARMTRLVADLLVLARADAGLPLNQTDVEVDRVLLDVMGEARHLARGQRLEIREVQPAIVRGDRDRLMQLFLNIVENAIKYTPASGVVTVSLRRDGQYVVIEVQDTGAGISADDLPRVFERFYRADRARARDPGGSGLGLSIADWIVGEHKGAITLTSRLGEGTTATVRLPAAR